MTTVSIKHRVLTTIDTTEITLPFYFTTGKLSKSYCCMTAEFKLITVWALRNGGMSFDVRSYDDLDEVADSIAYDMNHYEEFAIIDPAVFHHQFSVAHRELFYCVNPQLKPTE
jgi:hypothetical protein